MRIGSAEPQAVSHEIFRTEAGKPILCDSYDFDSIGAFLYTDFWGVSAIELRTQSLEGALEFSEYERLLKV